MDITKELIEEIAKDRLMSDLCLKYYMEQDPVIKEQLFEQIKQLQKTLFA
jgi:hypothetical protein